MVLPKNFTLTWFDEKNLCGVIFRFSTFVTHTIFSEKFRETNVITKIRLEKWFDEIFHQLE